MSNRSLTFLANLDLIALAVAFPIFIALDLALSAYAVAAVLWIASRLAHAYAERKAAENLLKGRRNSAMGAIAATSLGSAWMMAIGVLIAGVVDRDTGLYAAVLLVILFTLNLATRGIVAIAKSDMKDQTS